jgi:glycosyltransferase involved in cell wall biosynthesis
VINSSSNHLALLLTEFFNALPAAKIPFLVLRNYQELPHSTANDIDLLVHPDMRLQAEVVLADVAHKCGWRVHNRARFSPVCIFLHHAETSFQLQIDLFTRVEWRGIELVPTADLFARHRKFRDIPIPHPAHEALLNLTGRLLPYGFVREKFRHSIQETASAEAALFESSAAALFGPDIARQILSACVAADWKQHERMHKSIRRALVTRRPLHVLCGWSAMALRLTWRFLKPPGVWVVYLGADGSGKSTCLARSAELLTNTFSPGKSQLIHWKPIPFRKINSIGGKPNTNPHGKPTRSLPLSLAYLCWHWTQFLLGHWTVVKPVLFRNGAVYFDRHYADFLVDPRRFRLKVPRPLLRLLGRFLPQPDLILINNAPAEVLLARKSEVSTDECRRQAAAYAKLAEELPNTILINATEEPEQVAQSTVSAILDYLTHRTLARHPHLAVCGQIGTASAKPPPTKRIKVLLSAYACEPGRGSEPGVGWNIARELASTVNLHVLTRANNRRIIDSSGEKWTRDVTWHYWDPPRWLTFWKKGARGTQLFYILWQFGILRMVRTLHLTQCFDIVHHVTFGRYWIPSRLARLDCPFVFGPVGGADRTPPDLEMHLNWRGWLSDIGKNAVIQLIESMPFCRLLYQKAFWTLAATPQTAQALRNCGVSNLSILPQSGIEETFGRGIHPATRFPSDRTTRLITAARLIHWKAVDLAIEALAQTPDDVELVILQDGPDFNRLKRLAEDLGISNRVIFTGRLPTLDEVYQEISNADALIHPAVHEAFGQACLESLALGVPVICLDWAGPGLIVDSTCGFAILPTDRAETIKGLASAIRHIREEKQLGFSRSEACRSRAFSEFSWRIVGQTILTRYGQIMKEKQQHSRL